MFHHFVVWLAGIVGHWGYPGIVMLMALESSFFPFPSEVVIPSAAMGYWFGRNEDLVMQNLHWITMALVIGCSILVIFYWCRRKSRLL